MIKYGPAFYGSHEIHEILGRQLGEWTLEISQDWVEHSKVTFIHSNKLYRLPVGHWFYDSVTFKRAKKPTKPLADYSEAELQDKIKSMQAEIDRRKAQDDEITILARKICADNHSNILDQCTFLEGKCDNWRTMKVAKAAIIAGMKLQEKYKT